MTDHPKYTITTLVDMTAIPKDRFAAFLSELAGWHAGMHESGAAELFDLLAANGQQKPELTLVWNDDNDPGVKEVNLHIRMQKE